MTPRQKDFDAIDGRRNGATKKPWVHVHDNYGSRVVADGYGFSAPYRAQYGSGDCAQQIADNEFIANAKPDIEKLRAYTRRIEGSVAGYAMKRGAADHTDSFFDRLWQQACDEVEKGNTK